MAKDKISWKDVADESSGKKGKGVLIPKDLEGIVYGSVGADKGLQLEEIDRRIYQERVVDVSFSSDSRYLIVSARVPHGAVVNVLSVDENGRMKETVFSKEYKFKNIPFARFVPDSRHVALNITPSDYSAVKSGEPMDLVSVREFDDGTVGREKCITKVINSSPAFNAKGYIAGRHWEIRNKEDVKDGLVDVKLRVLRYEDGMIGEDIVHETDVDSRVGRMDFNPEGGYLAAGFGNRILLYKFDNGILMPAENGCETLAEVYGLAFTPDGKYLAAGTKLKSIIFLGFENGRLEPANEQECSIMPRRISFSGNGDFMAVASGENSIIIYKVKKL